MFLLTVWSQSERGEALLLLSVAIMGHVVWSMVKSEAENDMEAKFLMTSNGGSSLVAMRNMLGDSGLVAAASASGGDIT
jgi:hypothetical protein